MTQSQDWHERAKQQGWAQKTQDMGEISFETWKPSEGDSLVGKILTIVKNTGRNNDSTMAMIETSDGDGVGVWLSKVLQQEFETQKIAAGDVVGIKYHGKRDSVRSGHTFNLYSVQVFERGDAVTAADDEEFTDDVPF